MLNIVFCLDFSLKRFSLFFLCDVGRLLFWRSFENSIIEDIFGFINEIFFKDKFLVIKKVFHTYRVQTL